MRGLVQPKQDHVQRKKIQTFFLACVIVMIDMMVTMNRFRRNRDSIRIVSASFDLSQRLYFQITDAGYLQQTSH